MKTKYTLIFVLFLAIGCQSTAYEYVRRGIQHYRHQEYEAAANEFRMAIRYEPQNAVYHLSLGMACIQQNDLKNANIAFTKCLDLNPEYKVAVLNGLQNIVATNHEKKPALAIMSLIRIFELDSTLDVGADGYLAGGHYFAQKQYEKTILYLKPALQAMPDDRRAALARFQVAQAYQALNDDINAFQTYLTIESEALDRRTRDEFTLQFGQLCFDFATKLAADKNYPIARGVLTQLILLQQPATLLDDAYYLQGEILFNLGQPALAMPSFQKVIDLDPYQRTRLAISAKEKIKQLRTGKFENSAEQNSLEF